MTLAVMAILTVMVAVPAFAQNAASISLVLQDSSDDSAIGFATVSITKKGATKALKYALTDQNGKAVLEKLAAGTYVVKAEMMGYLEYTKEVTVADKSVDLGKVKMNPDQKLLDAASVSAVGNPIVVKKDTIEYNASSFKITENDMLEDLLKKFPGIEVGSDGSITANGQTITKIYVDGKTYFMDDPTLASKNLPAKIIEKVKVINKKSDQAEFTGIDDGQEETVLDLSVQKGMMNGLMGNLAAGMGHDLPVDETAYDEHRYTGNLFLGNFSNGHQYSVIGNANNGNNVGFGGFGGQMMRGMGGGGMGGGGGVTTSYMLGVNAGYDLFDDKMEATGSYNLNGSKSDSRSDSYSESYYGGENGIDPYSLIKNTKSISNTNSQSHNISMRINHQFSKSSSVIFEPQISFGTGSSISTQEFDSKRDDLRDGIDIYNINDGWSSNLNDQKQVSASARLQYRQRLGIPGRTLVINGNLRYSNTESEGYTQSLTNTYLNHSVDPTTTRINQRTTNDNNSESVNMRATYTEPMGNNFYVEGNYSLNWSHSNQDKKAFDSGVYDYSKFIFENPTYNPNGEIPNLANTNSIVNDNLTQQYGLDLLYQNDKMTAQVGFSVNPTRQHNKTERATYKIDTTYNVVNWSPQVMIRWEASDRTNIRFNYRGNSSQPSVSQLIPVLDNSNPVAQSLGNPYLNPYFSHNINSDIRYSNPRTFASFNIRINGGFTQNPIINAQWNENGKTFTMPVNGPTRGNASFSLFGNTPIARSNFSISTNTSASTSSSGSVIGNGVPTYYYDAEANSFDYALFMKEYDGLTKKGVFTNNKTITNSFSENLTFQFRSDDVEIRLGGGTRYSNSKYSNNSQAPITTWNNNIQGSFTWSWDLTGLSMKTDMNYRWYNGTRTDLPSEAILNGEISKLIFGGRSTISCNVYDLLGQTRNINISDSATAYTESTNNSLGRYIIFKFTWRFGTFGGGRGNRGGGNRGGGMGGFGGGMPGGGFGGPGGGMGGPF